MNVEELIELLGTYKPQTKVVIETRDPEYSGIGSEGFAGLTEDAVGIDTTTNQCCITANPEALLVPRSAVVDRCREALKPWKLDILEEVMAERRSRG